MTDTFEAKGKRKKLVAELRLKGITDEEVLRAIDMVPRHLFMDPAFLSHAYVDKAFPLTSGQTISQPYTVAVQSSLLKVKKRDNLVFQYRRAGNLFFRNLQILNEDMA